MNKTRKKYYADVKHQMSDAKCIISTMTNSEYGAETWRKCAELVLSQTRWVKESPKFGVIRQDSYDVSDYVGGCKRVVTVENEHFCITLYSKDFKSNSDARMWSVMAEEVLSRARTWEIRSNEVKKFDRTYKPSEPEKQRLRDKAKSFNCIT